MSAKTDNFEKELTRLIKSYEKLPDVLPSWMSTLGIKSGAKISNVRYLGSSGSKTDVIVDLDGSNPIKISAKLSSADYFGNWYSHTRVIREFGMEAFSKLTRDCTQWANQWKNNSSASLFVGVSVCFGKRSGNTAREFTQVFSYSDIVKIVAGDGSGPEIANCLYVSSDLPKNIGDLLSKIQPIDTKTIYDISGNFKIAYRPINPMTEGTNRGKCVYTRFKPYATSPDPVVINNAQDLFKLGHYETVNADSLNHNRILNELASRYNIMVDRKK